MNNITIKNNYVILHFDEFPILFIGKNHESDIVIGSLIFEEEETKSVQYFHSIISSAIAVKFLERKISYLEVLKAASCISIVTKNYNDTLLNVEETAFSRLDKFLLPLPSAYCPFVENKVVDKFRSSFEKPYLASYFVPETMAYPLSAAETESQYGIKIDTKV